MLDNMMHQFIEDFSAAWKFKSRITPENITHLDSNQVFVFGSNLAGIHGAGAAKTALNFGAKHGFGIGISGSTYGIPTKDETIKTFELIRIKRYVDEFIEYTKQHPERTFLVTEIGCGLAGYKPEQIGPMFHPAVEVFNIHLPINFWKVLFKTQFHVFASTAKNDRSNDK